MDFRVLKNKFREPLDKVDFKYFLKTGIMYMFLISIMCALIDSVLYTMMSGSGYSLVIAILLIFTLLAKQIKKNIYCTHIIYNVLFTVFCLFSLFIYNYVFFAMQIYSLVGLNIFSFEYIKLVFVETYNVVDFVKSIISFDVNIIWSLIKVILLSISYVNAIRIIKY